MPIALLLLFTTTTAPISFKVSKFVKSDIVEFSVIVIHSLFIKLNTSSNKI